MDSVTQLILGAAVGEAALGKKIGNRAMVWGAIAGTIPDLDVISSFFMKPIDALAFHRAIMHSFLFSGIMAIILGWLVFRKYKFPHHKWLGIAAWSLLLITIGILILFVSNITLIAGLVCSLILAGLIYWVFVRYNRADYQSPTATRTQWQSMFFLSLVTHPILDCFTTYGTQVFLPFSNYRVAFNNIAVADPAYTVPFLICLLIAAFLPQNTRGRTRWNNAGLIISSLYMIGTIFNKTQINTIFENSLKDEKISYSRYMTTPTILNNILWSGIAETDSAFYYGMYSFFDKEKKFKLKRQEKTSAEFNSALTTDPTLKTLQWFSNDYFALHRISQTSLEYSDLRFGTFRMNASSPEQFVFKFNLTENPPGIFYLNDQGTRPRDANFSEAFAALWERMMGKTQ